MIYFDNASTTNKKPLCVKLAVLKGMSKKYSANPGRSAHKLSINASMEIFKARQNFNEKFNNDCLEHVIFTSGCTEALNLAIFGTARKCGHIIISSNEHNSVARPVAKLKKDGIIDYSVVKARKDRKIHIEDIKKLIKENTYLVIINHCSNVTGEISNIKEIGNLCKEKKIMLLVDCAQSAGHIMIDMINDNIDLISIAGHKGLLGPQGVGVLIYKSNIEIQPIKYGGTGADSEKLLPPIIPPESLEAGTTCTPNIMGLNAGLNYSMNHLDKFNKKIEKITKFIIEELNKLNNVTIYTNLNTYTGVIAFNIRGYSPSDVATMLNDKNICIRGGMHCAPLVHENLGTLSTGGTCRISVGNNNSLWQAKKLIKVIKDICYNC